MSRHLSFAMLTTGLLVVAAPLAAEVSERPVPLDEDGREIPPQRWHEEMLQEHLDGERDDDSHGSVHEEETVGEWTFYTVTGWPQGADVESTPPSSMMTVRNGETIVDEEPEVLLGRIYESLNLIDGEELPEQRLLIATRYAIGDDVNAVRSPSDLPQAIRKHWRERFPDEDIHPPRFERDEETLTLRFFILSPFSTLTRYEVEVSSDYQVELDAELTMTVTGDPGQAANVLLKVRSHRLGEAANTCYRNNLPDDADAKGKVSIALTIGEKNEEGTITDITVVEETVSDDDSVGECIADQWHDADLPSFSAPEDGDHALLVVPYQFSP